jgi:uncharacterized membrane protein
MVGCFTKRKIGAKADPDRHFGLLVHSTSDFVPVVIPALYEAAVVIKTEEAFIDAIYVLSVTELAYDIHHFGADIGIKFVITASNNNVVLMQ